MCIGKGKAVQKDLTAELLVLCDIMAINQQKILSEGNQNKT